MDSRSDNIIQATNDDATCSKAYAVRRGYWKDGYMHHFCPIPSRKSPEINRGYFVRTQAFKAIAVAFIKEHNHACQLVNLGAGSDTLYFQLRDDGMLPRKFVEIDLPYNVSKKIAVLKCKKLLEVLDEAKAISSQSHGDSSSGSCTLIEPVNTHHNRQLLVSGDYCLFSFDLREPVDEFVKQLCNPAFEILLDKSLPTLFLAECVLVYMHPAHSLQLIQGISTHFPFSAFLLYEQVNMCDKFGSIMIENFRARGCDLPGLAACQSLRDQEKRFLDANWKKAKAWTINEVYKAFSKPTRSRVEKVELLDDLEISQQLFDHYCILLAVTEESVCPWTHLEEPLSVIP